MRKLISLLSVFLAACGGGGSIETVNYTLCHPDAEDCTRYFSKYQAVYQIKPTDEYVLTNLTRDTAYSALLKDGAIRAEYVLISVAR